MKIAALLFAIVFAWCSGAAVDSSEQRNHANTGALFLLMLAFVCGYFAWRF